MAKDHFIHCIIIEIDFTPQADFVLGELNRLSAEDERTFCPVVVAGAKSLPVAAAGHNAHLHYGGKVFLVVA